MKAVATCTISIMALAVASAAAAAPATWAQHLVEGQLKAHKEVVSITVAVAKDEKGPLEIVGSTSGDTGEATKEQKQIVAEGHAHHTLLASGDLQVTEPLHDVVGGTIGTLTIVYRRPDSAGMAAADKTAAQIQAAVGKHLISAKNAVDPYPYSAMPERTLAQRLVDKTFAAHPEIIILATHSTPPGGKVNVISGSTIGRIGKEADEDDLRVIEKGETNLEVADNDQRFEVELPLDDAKGQRIGALGVVLRFHKGADKEALHRRAVAIRDEMAKQIPDAAALAQAR